MNKHKIAAVAAALLGLSMLGCSFNNPVSGVNGKIGTGATAPSANFEYRYFTPTSDAQIEAASADGEVNKGFFIVKANKGFDASAFARLGATTVSSFDIADSTYFRLRKQSGYSKLLVDLGKLPGVVYAENELLSSIPPLEAGAAASIDAAPAARSAASIAAVLNDPETWGRFGHFETTKAIAAYTADGFGPTTVYAADIDTGINRTHEDFADSGASNGQIVEYAKSAFNSTDGGATFTYVGDGSPFVSVPVAENWDDVDHGTHTAGTIAAVGNNGKGVAGVCWKNVKLISYKCFCDHTSNGGSGGNWAVYGSLADLVAWKNANSITQTIPVNMSLGGSYAGSFELDMINYALANDVVVIASMGNDGQVKAQYPAGYTGVIAIGATRANGQKVHFSSMGKYISVSAPGYNIYSVSNAGNDLYMDMSGTSMAAPFVTGTVAYMLTWNPLLKPDQIKTILEQTADDIGAAGWDQDTGWGQVDVKAAIDVVKAHTEPASGSVYCTKMITANVVNTNGNFDSGIVGHKSAVVGQTVYLYDANGSYVTMGLTTDGSLSGAAPGSVEFQMLKPGTYTAVTNYFGTKQTSLPLVLSNSGDATANFSFDVASIKLQTVNNDAYWKSLDAAYPGTGADTKISLFDSDGTTALVSAYDQGQLDSTSYAGLVSGKTYYVLIEPYVNASNVAQIGEYAIDIGFTGIASANVAPSPLRAVNVDDADANTDVAHAKLLTLDTPYAEYLSASGEWFQFVMP